MYRVSLMHDSFPDNRCHNFFKRSITSEYGTRDHRDLLIPKLLLEYTKTSFYFSGVNN